MKYLEPPKTSLFSKLKKPATSPNEPPTEENKTLNSTLEKPNEVLNQKKASAHNIRPATEDKMSGKSSPTKPRHSQDIADMGPMIIVNPLNLGKIATGTENKDSLSSSPRLVDNLPSIRQKSHSPIEERIDIGQMIRSGPIDQFVGSKRLSRRNEDLVDPMNSYLMHMLEMKLGRQESTSSLGVEVNVEDFETCMRDIKPELETLKLNSVDDECFLKIHDRSGFDSDLLCESADRNRPEIDSGRLTKEIEGGEEREDAIKGNEGEINVAEEWNNIKQEENLENSEPFESFRIKKEEENLEGMKTNKKIIENLIIKAEETNGEKNAQEELEKEIMIKPEGITNNESLKIKEDTEKKELIQKNEEINLKENEKKENFRTKDIAEQKRAEDGLRIKKESKFDQKREVRSEKNLEKSEKKNKEINDKKQESIKETKFRPISEKKEVINLREKNFEEKNKRKEIARKNEKLEKTEKSDKNFEEKYKKKEVTLKNEKTEKIDKFEKKQQEKEKEENNLDPFSQKKSEIMKEILTLSKEIETMNKEKEILPAKQKEQTVKRNSADFNERNAKWLEKRGKKAGDLQEKNKVQETNQCTFQPKTNPKKEEKFTNSCKELKNESKTRERAKNEEIVSFHSANIINEKHRSPEINVKSQQAKTKETNEKIRDLYANYQKIRENKNILEKTEKVEKKKETVKKSGKTQAKSVEKEINQEIRDILEIFKSANKALNSSKKNLEVGKNLASKFAINKNDNYKGK